MLFEYPVFFSYYQAKVRNQWFISYFYQINHLPYKLKKQTLFSFLNLNVIILFAIKLLIHKFFIKKITLFLRFI